MRAFRAEYVSRFVKAVLDREAQDARDLLSRLSPAIRLRSPGIWTEPSFGCANKLEVLSDSGW